jgi:hypothetical protein
MAATSDNMRRTRERARLASVPAMYVDGFTITWWSEGIRIAFSEYVSDERHYRQAVMMSLDDAEDLGKRLLTCVEKARKERLEISAAGG